MKQEVPCLNCEKRTPECHGSCEEYKVYKQKLKNIHDIRREIHDKNDELNNFKYEVLKKFRRRK